MPQYQSYSNYEIDELFDSAIKILMQGIVSQLKIELIKKDRRNEYHTAALYLHLDQFSKLSASCHDGYRDRAPTIISIEDVRTRFNNKIYFKPRR